MSASSRIDVPESLDVRIPALVLGLAIPSVVFIVLVLCTYAWLAWRIESRPYLNRVSFRLLVYALFALLGYELTLIGGAKPGAGCKASTFAANMFLMFSAVLFFSMALNLQLVLVHGFNGNRLEKFYILAAVILTLVLNVPPLAFGALGFDTNKTCWYNSEDTHEQMRWFVGTQAFWLLAMSFGEIVCFFSLLAFMFYRQRASTRQEPEDDYLPNPTHLPAPPIVIYKTMILRIGLYPLASCILSTMGSVVDIQIILTPGDPASSGFQLRLFILDLLVYVLRPMVYGILAATDPSFLRALATIRQRPPNPTSTGHPISFDTVTLTGRETTTQSGIGEARSGIKSHDIVDKEGNIGVLEGISEQF
ncbi:hypothetical protein MKEN_00434400 [Mycena kentingensis (nom. inval.)]|nr:hypothetical protein MKEN_00434400 [Mycena kentingensis (nom. inval.)]